MQHTKRPNVLLIRYGLQEITPRSLEDNITDDRGKAFEVWGQRILSTRVVWRSHSNIPGVQREQLVYLRIRCIEKGEFLQISA